MLYYRWIGWLTSLGGIALALTACGYTPAAAPITPTQAEIVPTEIPTPTPTAIPPSTATVSCGQPWIPAYGPGSPDLEAQIRQALAAEQISASVHSSTYGETGDCGEFHAASIDIAVTVQVKSITDRAELEALASQVLQRGVQEVLP